MMSLLQLTGALEVVDVVDFAVRIVGIGVLAMAASGLVAAIYRWYAKDAVGEGVAMLFGLAAAVLYLNVRAALGQVAAGETMLLSRQAVIFNLLALGGAVLAAPIGRRVGDRVARNSFPGPSAGEIDVSVGTLAARIGRATVVTLPDIIEDIPERQPVPETTKERLAGDTVVFGRRPADEQLRERVIAHVKEEESVGYVDVEIDGTSVTHLAVGARAPGLGPTLAPGSAAVPINTDPPVGVGPGDLVQVWGSDPVEAADDGLRRLATAEVRAVTGDVVTLVCDEAEADRIAGGEFRMLTLPTEPAYDREFASILRSVDETMHVVTVSEPSALRGVPIGALDLTIVAVQSDSGPIVPIPSRNHTIAAGDTLFAVARPDVLRRLERNAAGPTSGPAPNT